MIDLANIPDFVLFLFACTTAHSIYLFKKGIFK